MTQESPTYVLTMSDIKEIYRAGVTRGNDEATSFEWGSCPSGKYSDELEGALHDIFNHFGTSKFGTPEYYDFNKIKEMVNEYCNGEDKCSPISYNCP